MKHPLPTTIILVALFLSIQLIGLVVINKAITPVVDESGTITTEAPNTVIGEPPESSPWETLIMLIIGVTIGTVLVLLLAKFRKPRLWKIWFWLASGATMAVSLGILFGPKYYMLSSLICFIGAAYKVWKPNPIIHNLTELFIYPGIAVIFFHILNIPVVIVLLAIISAYDVVAVFGSKHMVKLAQFQTKTAFAGLSIPREFGKKVDKINVPKINKTKKTTSAILGGGDVAFPLLFSAVVMENLVLQGVAKNIALMQTSIISITSTIAIALLFFIAKKDKFYPAMPTVSVGALIGWAIILLL